MPYYSFAHSRSVRINLTFLQFKPLQNRQCISDQYTFYTVDMLKQFQNQITLSVLYYSYFIELYLQTWSLNQRKFSKET